MVTEKYVKLTLCLVLMVVKCEGYKILVVFPNPSRSHGNLGDGVVRHLLKAGHQVTYITPFVKETPQENLTFVDVSSNAKDFGAKFFSISQLISKTFELDQHSIFHMMRDLSTKTFENRNVKNFLESSETFDVVIAEWMFNELYSGFSAVFKCPLIWMFPFEPNFVALGLIDEGTNPSYAANFELNFLPPFNFIQRVKNLWFQIAYRLRYRFFYGDLEKMTYDKYFAQIQLDKHGFVVPYDVLRYNASLMLSYSHYSLGQALSIPQNLIPVGGYHVDENPPPLPTDLKKVMDSSKEGVVYFSMGSNLKSKDFPTHILQGLIKIFSEINYTVLWKFEGELTGYSNNVRIFKWTPQQSILAHPNCVLFITHGGLLSTTEAVHYGVPIIGIPVFYDQFNNVDRAVDRGFAKKVTVSSNFAEELKAAIEDILSDEKYSTKAKEMSFIYHNRPLSPGASMVHWIQHVAATKGSHHLRSPAFHLPWYQKYYIDLAILLILLASITISIVIFGSRCREYRVDFKKKFD